MEEKRIVLPELSCRTAPELPLPAAVEAVRPPAVRRCTPGAELRPKLSGCSGGCAPGAELPPKLAGPAGVGLGGSPAAQLLEYNPFLLHVAVHGLQRVKAKVPFPQFLSTTVSQRGRYRPLGGVRTT